MTRQELIVHIRKHGCEDILLGGTANVIKFRNPKTGKESFVNMPAYKVETWFNIERICTDLGIPIPPKESR